jgi:hypothetical protein
LYNLRREACKKRTSDLSVLEIFLNTIMNFNDPRECLNYSTVFKYEKYEFFLKFINVLKITKFIGTKYIALYSLQ